MATSACESCRLLLRYFVFVCSCFDKAYPTKRNHAPRCRLSLLYLGSQCFNNKESMNTVCSVFVCHAETPYSFKQDTLNHHYPHYITTLISKRLTTFAFYGVLSNRVNLLPLLFYVFCLQNLEFSVWKLYCDVLCASFPKVISILGMGGLSNIKLQAGGILS